MARWIRKLRYQGRCVTLALPVALCRELALSHHMYVEIELDVEGWIHVHRLAEARHERAGGSNAPDRAD
jgi:hypothetical protein